MVLFSDKGGKGIQKFCRRQLCMTRCQLVFGQLRKLVIIPHLSKLLHPEPSDLEEEVDGLDLEDRDDENDENEEDEDDGVEEGEEKMRDDMDDEPIDVDEDDDNLMDNEY